MSRRTEMAYKANLRGGVCQIQAARQGTDWPELGCLHGIPSYQAGRVPLKGALNRVPARLDGLLWEIGALSTNPGNRPLATPQGAHVLMEAMALLPHQGS